MENNIINHKEKLVTDGYTIIDDILPIDLALSLNAKSNEVIVVARERVNEFKSWINQ